MEQMIDVDPNKRGGISSPSLVFGVSLGDFDACRHLRPYLLLECRLSFNFCFPQSSEEDVTSVSIVGWVVNRRIVF
jgi:hypothetical protein